jgi:NADH-quinone oxidoreductase subunit L
MDFVTFAASLVFFAPVLGLAVLAVLGTTPLRTHEWFVTRIVAIAQSISFFGAVIVAYHIVRQHLLYGAAEPIRLVHHRLFSFDHHAVFFDLHLDGINIWFVLMATILSNIVGVFSQHYLHRDSGFYRFFLLIVLFLNGVLIVFMGSTFQSIFVGWEVVGITSALLISFFTVRRETIDNALHAFWAYRVSDIGLLFASVLLAAYAPGYLFASHAGVPIELPSPLAQLVPFLLLLSAMGKSAQFPYSSWLPRAMEGPTSSSAIFYGGLSIHAGVYLLLRLRLEYQVPTGVLVLMAFIGAISCLYGAMLTQVQSDVKSALAYASLSQVGIMFVEISLGWYHIATIHCLGHAFLRTYQILKCSSIIHQFVEFEDSHQHDIAAAKARFLPVLVPRGVLDRSFSVAFDLALRAASGPSRLVVGLERVSRLLARYEENFLYFITRLPRKGVSSK